MRRREFITTLGSAALWPVVGRAQRPTLPAIGYLGASLSESSPALAPFLDGLNEAGFVEGRNITIDYRWAEGQYDRLPYLAAELVERRVSVIVATGGFFVAAAAKAATSTIPIVFQGGGEDPVKEGLVESLARPGANVTGVMNLSGTDMGAKQVEFLRELLPASPSVGLLVNNSSRGVRISEEAQDAARALGWPCEVKFASTERGIEAAFGSLAEQHIGGLVVIPDPFFSGRLAQIIALAAQNAIPASYYFREFVLKGGLMSYGPDLRETNRIAAGQVARILMGEKPADLPVQRATKIQLAINMKTAKALGLSFPLTLLGRADEVIE